MRYYYPPVFQAILTQSILRTSSPSSRSVTALAPIPLRVTNSIPRIITDERRRRHFINHSIGMSSSSFTSPSTEPSKEKTFVVDPFCYRQFAEKDNSKGYAGAVLWVLIQYCIHDSWTTCYCNDAIIFYYAVNMISHLSSLPIHIFTFFKWYSYWAIRRNCQLSIQQ